MELLAKISNTYAEEMLEEKDKILKLLRKMK